MMVEFKSLVPKTLRVKSQCSPRVRGGGSGGGELL